MKKLKLLFTLLLLCAGVNLSWAQTYTKGTQVTSVDQLSPDKLYFLEHTYIGGTSTVYHYMYVNGLKTEDPAQYIKFNLNYNNTLPESNNSFYVWRLVPSATEGRFYLQNIGNPDCYVLALDSWAASYAGTSGTKGDFTITETGTDNTFKFYCNNGSGTYKCIGGMSGGTASNQYPNNINGVCGDNGNNHVQKIWEATSANLNYSTNYAGVTLGRKDRAVTEIKLETQAGTQTITGCQSNTENPPLFIDKTAQKFTCVPGEPITAKVTSAAGWTHLYIYVDENGDGFDSKVDVANHRAAEGSDLKAFTHYKFGSGNTGYNSLGQETGGGVSLNEIPSFKAPTTPGSYRMRFKTDWNSIDPRGDLGDGRGASATENNNNNIVKNGGAIIDIMLKVENPPMYSVTFVDEENNPLDGIKAYVNTGKHSFIDNGVNKVDCDATVYGFLNATDFLLRDILSISANGNTYGSWAELQAAVTGAADVTVKLNSTPAVQAGKYYTIQHAKSDAQHYMMVNASDNKVYVGENSINVKTDPKYLFRFDDAGDGKFYLHNVATNRYLNHPSTSAQVETTDAAPTLANNSYYITNATVPGSPDIFAFADPAKLPNPTTNVDNVTTRYFLHNNVGTGATLTKTVVGWSQGNTTRGGGNSTWYVQEVTMPIITLNFDLEGIAVNPTLTALNTDQRLLAENKVLACVTSIAVTGFTVESWEMGGTTYTTENRAAFYTACHALTDDATVTVKLIDNSDAKDFTIALWKTTGAFYSGEAEQTGTSAKATEWRFNNATTEENVLVKGDAIPTDLDFRINAVTDGAQIGGHINGNGSAIYHYGQTATTAPDGLTFLAAPMVDGVVPSEPYEYKMSVNAPYFILQYEMDLTPNSANYPQLITNDGGASVLTAVPNQNANKYNITDTPASQETSFYVKVNSGSNNSGNQPSMAVFYQVRVVNLAYLKANTEIGLQICDKALKGGVGYPKHSTQEYKDLQTAYNTFDNWSEATGKTFIQAYTEMLQAYSKYISCTDLQMPEDCQVYNLSFIKSDANSTKKIINNGDSGLELIDNTAENRKKLSARWISHENAAGKLVLVNKKDGKYLLANGSGVGVSETYDADNNSFTVRATHQDMSDYMASATDEKLLGAVCMKNAAETNKLTMQNADNTFAVKTAAEFNNNFSSAMLIEQVEGGNTFNEITLKQASDQKYYATYYSFYPVAKPEGTSMYYVNSVSESGVMDLIEVRANVIRPNFAVILISDDENLHSGSEETHLHIGEYTTDVAAEIEGYLEGKQNLLQGTVVEMATSEALTIDGQSGDVYVLSGKKDNKVGFYPYTAANLPIGRAYYVHPATAGGSGDIRAFHFTDENGVETTIELNAAETSADAVIYDLSGRRVKSAANGLFIINGKKVIK